jgi:hypothetical protein
VEQLPFQDILTTPQMRSTHRSRLITVGETSFDQLPACLQQLLAVPASDSPPISIDCLLIFHFFVPLPPSARRFRNLAASLYLLQLPHRLAAVMALIRYYLRDSFEVNLRLASGAFSASRSINSATASRSVSLVGLAPTSVIPQNNSTTECSFCDPVVVAS